MSRRVRSAGVLRLLSTLAALAILGPGSAAGQSPSFESVLADLRRPDASDRLRAVRQLRAAGYREAIAPVAALFADPDDRVQLGALEAERALFMVPGRPEERALSAGRLAVMPIALPPELLPAVAAALRDENPRVRLEALYTFGTVGPLAVPRWRAPGFADAVTWTVEALKRGDLSLQLAAAQVTGVVLKDCGVSSSAGAQSTDSSCAAAGNALIETINSRDQSLRFTAMRALGQLRYTAAVQALTEQFSYYRRGEAAEAALEGLAGVAHRASVPLFNELLGRPEPAIRFLAVDGIGRSGDRGQLAAVQRIVASEKSEAVQLAAAYASQRLGGAQGVGRLIDALANPDLQTIAREFLIELSPSAAGDLLAHLRDPDPATRAEVADILGFSGDLTVVPSLEAACKDADRSAASAAERGLARVRLTAEAAKP
jgi:HEAT repeat protein